MAQLGGGNVMFFETVRKNSRKNRKENGLLFVSLIVSIAAFYIILSLENQDVMVFLKKMESDAVQKLLLLIPVLYGISLFFLFFLVYFSDRYRMEQRSHEMGIYLMFGMGRRKLFAMLLAEDIWNSILSLAARIRHSGPSVRADQYDHGKSGRGWELWGIVLHFRFPLRIVDCCRIFCRQAYCTAFSEYKDRPKRDHTAAVPVTG